MTVSMRQSDIIKLAAEVGAKAALDTINKEKEESVRQRHDKRLHNTKLLLYNYRVFVEHINNSIYDNSQVEESPIEILDSMWKSKSGAVYVESIKKSIARTKIIMTHIDEMFRLYEAYCYRCCKTEERRRFRVTKMMYIDDEILSAGQIAKIENIDRRTVYRDVDAAVEKLSALIFGIDGIKSI